MIDTDQRIDSLRATLADREFRRLVDFIYNECGIKLSDAKRIMLETRLQKRLRKLHMHSFMEYCDFLFSPEGMEQELVQMIDIVTTNKTDFFREPEHFNFLVTKALPAMTSSTGAGVRRPLMVWSAGCSSGEEPYTLSMVLSDYAENCQGQRFSFMILATDISTRVLDIAQRGIYDLERIEPVPSEMKRKYLMKGKNKNRGLFRVAPELRELVRFRRLNFLEGEFGFREKMDIIFCRNVMIYFDRKTQENLLNRFCGHLDPNGYIFTGHSETLHGMDVPLVQVAPSTYRKAK